MTQSILTGISIGNNIYVSNRDATACAMTEDVVASEMRMDILVSGSMISFPEYEYISELNSRFKYFTVVISGMAYTVNNMAVFTISTNMQPARYR